MKADLETIRTLVKRVKFKIGNILDFTDHCNALNKELKDAVELAWESIIEFEQYLMEKEDTSDRLDDIEGKIETLFNELARQKGD